MKFEGIMLNEIRQMEKGKYCIILPIFRILKKKKNKQRNMTSRDCESQVKYGEVDKRVQTFRYKMNKVNLKILNKTVTTANLLRE